MPIGTKLFGDWQKGSSSLKNLKDNFPAAAKMAMMQEAHFLRSEIVKGLDAQAPAGEDLKPLSPLTIAARKFAGFKGDKALIRRADMRNSITVKPTGAGVFVGILRTAKNKGGQSLVNLAKLHEEGGGPYVVPITTKSRRWYHAMLAKAGIAGPAGVGTEHGGGATVAIIKIPARPFMGPVFNKFGTPDAVRGRFFANVARLMNG